MKVNQLKAGAALSYLSMGLGYLISIIYTPIMLRLLGQSEYGLYNLVASVVAYLGVLNFGFGSAYIRYYSRYKEMEDKEKIARLNGMFLIAFSTIGFIAILAGVGLVLNTERIFGSELSSLELSKAKTLLAIMVLNLGISFPEMVFSSYITANEKFIFQKLLQMIKTVANPFIVLPALILGYGSVGMVIMTTILNVSIEVGNVWFCIRKLKMRFSFKSFDYKLMREITVFSSYIFINLIIDQINWNVDKFILGRFHGTVAVAVYGLAAQLNTYFMTLSTAISSVFIPRIHKMVAMVDSNDNITDLFTKVGRVQFMLLSSIASGFIFFGKPFISMWAGNNYVESYPIFLLLAIPAIVPLIQNIGIEITRAKNMHQFRSGIYFVIAIANILLTIPLAKAFEGRGAALGTALSLFIGNGLLMNWYYHNRVGINIRYFWRNIFDFIPSLIVPITVGIILSRTFDLYNTLEFFCCGLLYIGIFCLSTWFIGMNQYEKNLFGKPIKKMYYKMMRRL